MNINTKVVQEVLNASGIIPAKKLSRPFPAGRAGEPNQTFVCRTFEIQVYNAPVEQALFVATSKTSALSVHLLSSAEQLERAIEVMVDAELAAMETARANALKAPTRPSSVARPAWGTASRSQPSQGYTSRPSYQTAEPAKPADNRPLSEKFAELQEAIERGDV